ncbi:MAG: hypothetical protein QG657_647 [Acidobacteriota bacterium]|nr:hypothetical protein [Acidobacteriota bacterium]
MDLAQRISNLTPKQKELLELKLKNQNKNIDISKLTAIQSHLKGQKKGIYPIIKPVEKKEYYPLSSAQKRMYILWQVDETGVSYNNMSILKVTGNIDKDRIENTFRILVNRHEGLRTSFEMIEGEVVQRIHDNSEFELVYYEKKINGQWALISGGKDLDSSRYSPHSPHSIPSKEIIIKAFHRPFDLAQKCQLRVALLKEEENEYILLVDVHHIILDGITVYLINKDLMEIYNEKELPELKIQYKDFAEWLQSPLMREMIQKQESYWLKEFAGEIPVMALPIDFPRSKEQNFEGKQVDFEVNADCTRVLRKYALQEGASLFMVLLTVFYIFLNKLSGEEDILVGVPIAGRRQNELEHIVGMFVNTLVLRNFPLGEKNFELFLGEVKGRTLEAFENQDYPYDELVKKVVVNRDSGRNPIFDVMFGLQNMKPEPIEVSGLRLEPYNYKQYISKFDFSLKSREIGEVLWFGFEYKSKLFKANTIERFISYFKKLISILVEKSSIRIADIELITGEEKRQILFHFNDTKSEYPTDMGIHRLFEDQVRQRPGNTAFGLEELHLSYHELNKQSDKLAYTLMEKGVGANVVVGLIMQNSPGCVISILGVLKAGGAYLPLDPDYPEERKNYIISDSNIKILLTDVPFRGYPHGVFSGKSMETISLCNIDLSGYAGENDNHDVPGTTCTPSNLAYIIYTSGTTGKPKGSLIEHRGLVNYIYWRLKTYHYTIRDVTLQLLSYCFDGFGSNFYSSLCSGGMLLYIPESKRLDYKYINKVIKLRCVTNISLVPGMYDAMLDAAETGNLVTFRFVVLAGERTWGNLLIKSRELNANLVHVNEYGPTEGTVTAAANTALSPGNTSIIGKPISNVGVYILNSSQKIVPIGVTGEMHIAGAGITRGYLNNPLLTAEKFSNFYHSSIIHHSKLYKTGDLARWLEDGNIEFLGRVDHQVKIRGYRFELGEIEAQLLKHEKIKETVVITRDESVIRGASNSGKYLCAYIISREKLHEVDLKTFLSTKLPAYMIPSYFISIEKIPLTPNGKINRNALPVPEIRGGFISPRDEIEEKLARIWSQVLEIEKRDIGIDHNFFQLGGHSIKVSVQAAKIQKEFNLKLSMEHLFSAPTIRELGQLIKGLIGTNEYRYVSLEPVEKKEYYVLSSAQKRLFILQQMELESTVYNVPQVVSLELVTGINEKKLEQVIPRILDRHESFRTSFEIIDEKPVQRIHETQQVDFKLEYFHLEEGDNEAQVLKSIESIFRKFVRPFKLSQAPLIRLGLITVGEHKYFLMIDMHHIISDLISQIILRREFFTLMEGRDLPPLRIQYKDYAEWQNSEAQLKSVRLQEEYWLKEYQGRIPLLNLPLDYDRGKVLSFEGDSISFSVDGALNSKVRELAGKLEVTLMMFLFSIYKLLLARLGGQEELVVGTVAAVRPHTDLENIVGFFVNMLPIKTNPGLDKSFSQYLQEVKEKAVKAYENQGYPFEELVNKLDLPREQGRHPLVDAVFAFGNDLENEEDRKRRISQQSSGFTGFNITHFDLLLYAADEPDSIQMRLQYSTDLFNISTIEDIAKFYLDILEQVVEKPVIKLREIVLDLRLSTSSSAIIEEDANTWEL